MTYPWSTEPVVASPKQVLTLLVASMHFVQRIAMRSAVVMQAGSPASTISPPMTCAPAPVSQDSTGDSSIPLVVTRVASPKADDLLQPVISRAEVLSATPARGGSSVFVVDTSYTVPFRALGSPISFRCGWTDSSLMPTPSTYVVLRCSKSPPEVSKVVLRGTYKGVPLSVFLVTLYASSLSTSAPHYVCH